MECAGGFIFVRRRADVFLQLALGSAARWMCGCAVIAASLNLGGCKRNEYAIELHEVPAGLDRKLTGEITQDEDRHRIAGLYEQDAQTVAEKTLDFQKVFSSKMPDDIGGVGTTTRWTSSQSGKKKGKQTLRRLSRIRAMS